MWNVKRYDWGSGLYMYKYRHYDAEHGRWSSRDPIEELGGVNQYSIIGNEPLRMFDKLGLKKCCGTREFSVYQSNGSSGSGVD